MQVIISEKIDQLPSHNSISKNFNCSNLEFRIAMKVAKSINEKPKTSRSRPFGSSVPLGPDNEAECVRVELPPASSSNALPAAKKLEKISVFTVANKLFFDKIRFSS